MLSNRDARFWIHAWWPVAVLAALIAFGSSPRFGTDHTSGPLRWLWQFLFGPVGNRHWDLVHVCIRKGGHFIVYGVLGLACLRAWRLSLPRLRLFSAMALALLGTAAIASCDEFHQSFLPNRGGSPWDVLLDCCGAATFCLLASAIVLASQRKRKRRHKLDGEPRIIA